MLASLSLQKQVPTFSTSQTSPRAHFVLRTEFPSQVLRITCCRFFSSQFSPPNSSNQFQHSVRGWRGSWGEGGQIIATSNMSFAFLNFHLAASLTPRIPHIFFFSFCSCILLLVLFFPFPISEKHVHLGQDVQGMERRMFFSLLSFCLNYNGVTTEETQRDLHSLRLVSPLLPVTRDSLAADVNQFFPHLHLLPPAERESSAMPWPAWFLGVNKSHNYLLSTYCVPELF